MTFTDLTKMPALLHPEECREGPFHGELITAARLCACLGISRGALNKAVRDRRLFRVDRPGRRHWYPSFLAATTADLEAIGEVSIRLAEMPGAEKLRFFITPKYSLGGQTPLQVLEHGDLGRVMRTASEFRERSMGR